MAAVAAVAAPSALIFLTDAVPHRLRYGAGGRSCDDAPVQAAAEDAVLAAAYPAGPHTWDGLLATATGAGRVACAVAGGRRSPAAAVAYAPLTAAGGYVAHGDTDDAGWVFRGLCAVLSGVLGGELPPGVVPPYDLPSGGGGGGDTATSAAAPSVRVSAPCALRTLPRLSSPVRPRGYATFHAQFVAFAAANAAVLSYLLRL